MKDKYLIGLANLVNGSMLGYEDKGNIEQYKKWITDYVKSLENGVRMNKEELLKEIMRLPKVETINSTSAMNVINVDDLMSAVNRFDRVPDYNDLLKENQELKDNWDKLIEFILEEGFEINTREYGSLDVIDKNVMLEEMQELEGSDSSE